MFGWDARRSEREETLYLKEIGKSDEIESLFDSFSPREINEPLRLIKVEFETNLADQHGEGGMGESVRRV